MSKDTLMGYVTAPSMEIARMLATKLLEARLVACVNVFTGVESIYRWKGGIEMETETLMVLKTSADHREAIVDLVEREHPYDVPECIFTEVVFGNLPYLQWVHEETQA